MNFVELNKPNRTMEEDFEQIWAWIIQNAGEPFNTIRGNQFSYEVIGNRLQIIGNAEYHLSQGNFLRAFPHFDPNALGKLPKSIVGRSYVWGIFNGYFNQPG